jgi:hypothetical protein
MYIRRYAYLNLSFTAPPGVQQLISVLVVSIAWFIFIPFSHLFEDVVCSWGNALAASYQRYLCCCMGYLDIGYAI